MKKYYCLLLNNCYDIGKHWVCKKPFSIAPNILVEEIADLSSLEATFMDLDDTIIKKDDSYLVTGGFPVLGEIREDGRMYDVLTGRLILKSTNPKEANGLSYREAYIADTDMAEEMLTLIDDESRTRYERYLEDLSGYSKKVFYGADKAEKYLLLRLENTSVNSYPVVAKVVDGQIIDLVTKERIRSAGQDDTITSQLSTKVIRGISESAAKDYQIGLIDAGIENYINNIRTAKTASIRAYNTFVAIKKDMPKTKKR